MITGEWWNADPEAVINQALQTGAGPNVSDAYTMNGLPGPLYNCSSKGKPHKSVMALTNGTSQKVIEKNALNTICQLAKTCKSRNCCNKEN